VNVLNAHLLHQINFQGRIKIDGLIRSITVEEKIRFTIAG